MGVRNCQIQWAKSQSIELFPIFSVMTLHEAIEKLLFQQGRAMTTTEIAEALNKNSWYTKKDGSLIQAFQIHGRTRNYAHIFNREGSLVSLKSKTGISPVTAPQKPKASLESINSKPDLASKVLMNEKNFKSASIIDSLVPDQPGLYCIRIQNVEQLSSIFAKELKIRGHNIIYIGIASQSLKRRMLGQELRARGHGTFFRSLGAVLGYRPESGSLADKANKDNYTFSSRDEVKIIQWINQNLLVNWVTLNRDINSIENQLITNHLPLLNLAGNPSALPELKALRDECKRVARG